jgi:ABC-2 type transport system permease protein
MGMPTDHTPTPPPRNWFVPVIALLRKDLTLLVRDRVNFFFTFFFPIILGLFFGLVFSNPSPPGISIAVVDEDQTARSSAFIAELQTTDGIRVTSLPSREIGFNAVRKGNLSACIVIPKGFESATSSIFRGTPPTIEGVIDPSRQATSGLLLGRLQELAFRNLMTSFTDPAVVKVTTADARRALAEAKGLDPIRRAATEVLLNSVETLASRSAAAPNPSSSGDPAESKSLGPAQGFSPIKIDIKPAVTAEGAQPKHAFHITFPSAVTWALMGAVVAFSTSLVTERTQGTLMRLTTAPISKGQILAGKAAACFITAFLAQSALIAIMVSQAAPQSWWLLLMAMTCAALGFVGLMVLLSVISPTEGGGGGLSRAALLLLAMFGGGSIPLAFMPQWMQTASSISPFKWAVIAVEGAVWRDYSFAEMLLPCGILLGMGAVCASIGWSLFQKRRVM